MLLLTCIGLAFAAGIAVGWHIHIDHIQKRIHSTWVSDPELARWQAMKFRKIEDA